MVRSSIEKCLLGILVEMIKAALLCIRNNFLLVYLFAIIVLHWAPAANDNKLKYPGTTCRCHQRVVIFVIGSFQAEVPEALSQSLHVWAEWNKRKYRFSLKKRLARTFSFFFIIRHIFHYALRHTMRWTISPPPAGLICPTLPYGSWFHFLNLFAKYYSTQ